MPIPILYDIPSKKPLESWSLNPWKTRLALNFKKIDYQTEWVEYPAIAPLLKSFGLPPNDPTDPDYFTAYSIPTVRFDERTYVMESKAIAAELEQRYPDPPLHPSAPLVAEVQKAVNAAFGPLTPILISAIPRNLLTETSAGWFEDDRKARMGGVSLAQMEAEKGGEKAWGLAAEPAAALAALLKKNEGPFLGGEKVQYADFLIVSFLHFVKRVDQRHFERFVALDPAFAAIYDASKEWLARGDH
ncbi:uncharacterized protein BDZ99DRAFT_467126 [Mytilinidion resinicola]|uniref:GST N-terminal domain-containing protein n=1 Tax=Mytilinidion resinicola TaxID=574789 RepID=A0A6A6YAM9_9PEZI|nr:uncharacterized protein BDZ99DRAFT_467126 [Mytilinidion resinicola]KAF2804887.1 hypothetical protein BDZ99DRAFT_467126 [Mytilinidion resinicola]